MEKSSAGSIELSVTSKEASLGGSSPSSEVSQSIFFRQPPEIRNKIYRHLLDLNECDTSYDNSGVKLFHLCPNIMRTCKRAYREGHGILYGSSGPVATVVLYYNRGIKGMESGLLTHFQTRYTKSVVGRQLHIAIRPTFVYPSEREPVAFVLVGDAQLKDFFRFLKLWNYARNDGRGISYEFNFEPYNNVLNEINVPQESMLKTQRQLAGLFAGLRSSNQIATSKGLLDKELERQFISRLNDDTIWLRAEIWEFYLLVTAKYNQASNYWAKGDLDQAVAIYKHLNNVFIGSMAANPVFQETPLVERNDPVQAKLVSIMSCTQYNLLLARTLGTYYEKFKRPSEESCQTKEKAFSTCLAVAQEMSSMHPIFHGTNWLPKSVNDELWILTIFLTAINGCHPIVVTDTADLALTNATDPESKEKLEELMLTIATEYLRAPMLGPEVLDKIINAVDHSPARISPLSGVKSPTVRKERYMLSKLRYKGPLYENHIKPKVVRSIDRRTGEVVIKGDKVDKEYCDDDLDRITRARWNRPDTSEMTVWITPGGWRWASSCAHHRDAEHPFGENFDPPFAGGVDSS